MNEHMVTAKKFADELLDKAQGLLCRDGYLASTIFAVKENDVIPVLLHIKTDEDKDAVPGILRSLTKDSEYIVLISDSFIKPLEEGEIAPPSPSECSDAIEAIICFLYLRGETHVRKMSYIKKGTMQYNFFDQGWELVIGENFNSRFANPYD